MKAKPRVPLPRPVEPFSAALLIERWRVFTLEAFRAEHAATGASARATATLLNAQVEAEHLLRLRRGLYAAPGRVDPHLLASLLTPDAVLAYDGALSFHGLVELEGRLSFLSFFRCRPFVYDEVAYQAVRPAQSLKRRRALVDGVEEHERGDWVARVTSRERTLVDVLDRLDLLPSVWALVEAFRGARRLDVGAMVDHAEALDHPLAAARLGFVLETLGLGTRAQVRQLEALAPRAPVYFDAATRSEPSLFERRWQLTVPLWLPNGLRGQLDFGPDGPPSRAP